MSYNTKVYRKQGGDELVVAAGGVLRVQSGGQVVVEAGGEVIEGSIHPVASLEMVAAAAASNVCEVTITAKDAAGNTVAAVHQFDLWLSDDADGQGHTGTTASGTVTAKAASGLVVDTQVAKKALTVQSLKTGVFVLEITDTAKTAFKVCAKAPGNGRTIVGVTLAGANYGA